MGAAGIDVSLRSLIYEKDTTSVVHFLLTYKLFCSPEDLWKNLMYTAIEQKLQYSGSPTSVAKFLALWLDTSWSDFKNSKQMRTNLLSYLASLPTEDANRVKLACVRNYRSQSQFTSFLGRRQIAISSIPSWDPDGPSRSDTGELKIPARVKWFNAQASIPLRTSPEVLVQQLVLFEQSLFQQIDMKEFFGKAWQGDGKEKRAPHITALTRFFNYVSYWVTSSILTAFNSTPHAPGSTAANEAGLKELIRALKDAVRMAEHAYRLRTFNTLAEIIAGVSHCSVERLPRQVWDAMDEPTRECLARLSNLCSPTQNYARYRAFMNNFLRNRSTEAALPLMPVLLRDITFINDANPDTIRENGSSVTPNWKKVQLLGTQLANISAFKRVAYPFCLKREIIESLLKATPLNETELYDQLTYINEQMHTPATALRPMMSRELRIDIDQLLLRPITSWAPPEVAAWLRSVNMNEWAPVLLDARVDGATLISLETEQLVTLGLTKLGVRKRLQRHIQNALENKAGTSDDSLTDDAQSHLEFPRHLQQWAPEHVKAWLRSIGEAELLHCFHTVNGQQLVEMNEGTLTELGVLRLGARKRFMRELHVLLSATRSEDHSDESSVSSSKSPGSVSSSPATFGAASIRARSADTVERDSKPVPEVSRHSSAPALLARDPRRWGVDEVLAFLDMNELSEHRQAFSKAGVHGERLIALGDNELAALGLTKLGHRKKLMRAVRELASSA